MQTGWRIALLLLLVVAAGEAQSGDGDADTEPRISCSSHIAYIENSLTCQLTGVDNEDDEDDEGNRIDHMTLCYVKGGPKNGETKCLESPGDTIRSKDLHPVPVWNLKVHLKSGDQSSATVDLKKIVKPRSPQVWNVTFDQEGRQAVIYIRTKYSSKDYLTLENQLFQLHITPGVETTQNFSSQNFLKIDMQHLHKHSEYRVKVRAIPQKHFQGSWSEWSNTFSFVLPAVQNQDQMQEQQEIMYMLIVCIIFVLVVTSSVVAFWKKRIFTYMWPSIPHPKQTLVQVCKPNKGLLLNFNPEVFSHLKVFPLETPSCEEVEPSISPAAAGSCSSSTQSSDCRSTTSVSTEELELSALLSRSSSDGQDSLPSASPSPDNILPWEERSHMPEPENGGNEVEFGVNKQEEAYVTMSSFYQIK
ncbi:interleukin-7 receptor subunit alpha [Melanotaenia boesemani]|uniref:interleukin-7 receptor subunit alpha n=1 Tax=Melanotaenia boesemani TaxID=1250792 RepID=UPI001C03B058|nr:interleukin-7 receptor subunit alpha [Melanotaenia boesemani]